MPGPGSSELCGCNHLLSAPRSAPEPCWAFGQGAGSSLLTILDLLSGHIDDRKRLQMIGFSQCLSGEREGGRNTGLRHLPASSGTVPSCCKVGWWSSEMNPTDSLKQIGLVGAASKMNNSTNLPRKEKQRATFLQVPPSLTGISTCLKEGLPLGWLPNCSKITPLYLLVGQCSPYP